MKVVLYRVGRNLNRAIRTSHAFGISELVLIDCAESSVRGRLFDASIKIVHAQLHELRGNIVALHEQGADIATISWASVDYLLVGGETSGIPRCISARASIPCKMLTVEAALAIGLYCHACHK